VLRTINTCLPDTSRTVRPIGSHTAPALVAPGPPSNPALNVTMTLHDNAR